LQTRLMAAVSAPVGIAHLEDPAVLERLELARGTLTHAYVTDAPNALASIISSKLQGMLSCAVIASFRWWLGLGILVFGLVVRPPLRRTMMRRARSFSGEAGVLRRASYFYELVARPLAAKEL